MTESAVKVGLGKMSVLMFIDFKCVVQQMSFIQMNDN